MRPVVLNKGILLYAYTFERILNDWIIKTRLEIQFFEVSRLLNEISIAENAVFRDSEVMRSLIKKVFNNQHLYSGLYPQRILEWPKRYVSR